MKEHKQKKIRETFSGCPVCLHVQTLNLSKSEISKQTVSFLMNF